MNRQEYAAHNRAKYIDWAGAVADSPLTIVERLEFAVVSAHTPMRAAVAGWRAARMCIHMEDVAEALYQAGVVAPYNKAAYIDRLREEQPVPTWPYRSYRREVKLPGLGFCKLSFGCCLVDPLGSDVVCLDTHILQVLWERRPTAAEVRRVYTNLFQYETFERVLVREAEEVGLPYFPYQWAVWDWKRAKYDHLPVSNHSFLWANPSDIQLPLFSSLD